MSIEAVKKFVTRLVHDEAFRTAVTEDFDASTRDLELDPHERASVLQVRDAYVSGGPAGVAILKHQFDATELDIWV